MELPGALQSMGEGAITLAGLAAVFRAFQGGRDPQRHSRTRLDAVIEGGIVVAYLCFFPAWLLSTSVSQEFVWRVTGLPAAVWVAARSLVPGLIILRKDGTSPPLIRLGMALVVAVLLTFGLVAFALLPMSAYSGYLLGTTLLLLYIGSVFVAQFRAEADDNTPAA